MVQDIQKIWSLYKITNKINSKIYIGQAQNYRHRWSDHKLAAIKNKPIQVIHYAMIKYGLENFEFEVIACCKNQDDANFIETELVKQYDSFIKNGKGYNVTLGGMNAPKSEEFKQMMRDWHALLSPEEKQKRSEMHRKAMIHLIETKGHPAQGNKWTNEQKNNLSIILKAIDKDKWYTDEVRLHMSESHIGYKDSEEVKQKKSESAKEAWEKRIDYSRHCEAPGCTVCGKAKYKIIDGVRYCNKHGLRMLRYGRLERIKS